VIFFYTKGYLLNPLFLRFEDHGGAVMACG